jgi:hypothetical protein
MQHYKIINAKTGDYLVVDRSNFEHLLASHTARFSPLGRAIETDLIENDLAEKGRWENSDKIFELTDEPVCYIVQNIFDEQDDYLAETDGFLGR